MKNSFKNPSDGIITLWQEGFFKKLQGLKSISKKLEEYGNNFNSMEIGVALLRNKKLFTRKGKRGSFEYIQKREAVDKKIKKIEDDLFSTEILNKTKKDFKVELEDLKINFGRSGTCTAFLLRKFLEKLIYISFAHHNLTQKLEDKSNSGRLVGLEAMINIASSEKVNGTPFITPKTADKIQGIKFLGDTSAHNPLINVDMETITPQMPFIITAYKEIIQKI